MKTWYMRVCSSQDLKVLAQSIPREFEFEKLKMVWGVVSSKEM